MNDATIREWKGTLPEEENSLLPLLNLPIGGYFISFYRGQNLPYKIEHYDSFGDIMFRYKEYIWICPNENDSKDILWKGILR